MRQLEEPAWGPRTFVATDPETGCQYVVPVTGGVFPRLTAEGEPMCAHNSRPGLRPAIEVGPDAGDVR